MKITKEKLQRIIREEEQKLIVETKTRKAVRQVLGRLDEGLMDKLKGAFGGGKPSEKSIGALYKKMIAAGEGDDFDAYQDLSRKYIAAATKRPDLYDDEEALKDGVYKLDQRFGFAREETL